jgi:hypothetical protein
MKVPYTKCGKCGDQVFQRARYGLICYQLFVPANPRSYRQRFVRKNWLLVAMGWRLLTQEERLAWHLRAKSKKTRRRLGQSWPLPGFNYYMRENMLLANRGQPQLARPPVESRQPRPELPLLTRTLSPQQLQRLLDSPQAAPESPGPAPPASG